MMATWKQIFKEKTKDDIYHVPVMAFTMSDSNYPGISGFHVPSRGCIKCEYCSTEYPENTERIKCESCGAPLKRTNKRVIMPPPGVLTVPVREVLK